MNETKCKTNWIRRLPYENTVMYSDENSVKMLIKVESLLEKNSRFPKFDPVSKTCKEL